MDTYDVCVIGVGGIGSAALFHLARRGQRVIGVEQFSIAHHHGSSHGQTRLIRQAYFEHSDYVPLVLRSYEGWRELEERSQQRLLDPLGLVEIGRPGGEVLTGIRRAAREHALHIEPLTASESQRRFPMFRVPKGMEAIFEPTAGLLYVESCVAAHVRAATSLGATIRSESPIQRIEFEAAPIQVHTQDQIIRADRLVICAGAWTSQVFEVPVPLRVERKHLHWFPTDLDLWFARNRCPTFFYELEDGCFYGFPAVDSRGVKVAEHSGGEPVSNPSTVDRTPDPRDDRRVTTFLNEQLPGIHSSRTRHCVCMYTRSPDDHFILDFHPRHPNIAFAAGLSGHGFKFAPALGEALADLVVDGSTKLPVDFLTLGRFGPPS